MNLNELINEFNAYEEEKDNYINSVYQRLNNLIELMPESREELEMKAKRILNNKHGSFTKTGIRILYHEEEGTEYAILKLLTTKTRNDKIQTFNQIKYAYGLVIPIEIAAYEKVGKKELITLGNKLLEKGWMNSAILAYEKAGKKELITLGNKLLKARMVKDAIMAYERVGKEELIKCGNKLLEKGWISSAVMAYEKAGNKQGLIECGERALEKGWITSAIDAYEKAGEKMPKNLEKE